MWHSHTRPTEIFGQHLISLFLHTTGWFSNKASPVRVGRRIKKRDTSVQDRKPKSHAEMEDFKHRRAAALPCPLGRGLHSLGKAVGRDVPGLDVV